MESHTFFTLSFLFLLLNWQFTAGPRFLISCVFVFQSEVRKGGIQEHLSDDILNGSFTKLDFESPRAKLSNITVQPRYEFCQSLGKHFNLPKPQALHFQSRDDDSNHLCREG